MGDADCSDVCMDGCMELCIYGSLDDEANLPLYILSKKE